MAKYSILKIYYNKQGINDGTNYQVVDSRLQQVSNHKSMKLAEKRVKVLNKIKKRKWKKENLEKILK